MKKIIVNDCVQYFTALEEIKKGIKAQILDYDEDEEIDGGFAAEEITKLSDGVPVELWTANMLDYVYKKKYIGHMWQNLKGASMSSFLLIGEFEQVDKLMELLPKLEKNYKEIANIINLVCDEKGINKVIYLIQGIDGASLILFSFGGES